MGLDEKFDPEKTVNLRWLNMKGRYRWLIDNETGAKVLVDTEEGKEIGRWIKSIGCPLCGKE